MLLVAPDVVEHAVALEDLDVLQRHGCRQWMAAERDAVTQHPTGSEERLGDAVGHEHGPHRRVRGRQPFRHGGQVGHHTLSLDAQPLTESTKAANDLV